MKKITVVLSILIILIASIFAINCNFNKNYIAVIGAMDSEIEEISKKLSNYSEIKNSNFKIVKGKLNKNNIILAKSGVGKVNSAITTQFIIDKFHPKYIINTGLAGALDEKLKIGDIIIADKMVQYDFDLTAFNRAKGYMSTGIDPNKPTIYNSDKNLIEKFKNKEDKIYIGTIATGDTFVSKINQKKEIRQEFNALAADMESASIAQTAMKNNVPVVVIRMISDTLNTSANDYDKTEKDLANQSSKIVSLYLATN